MSNTNYATDGKISVNLTKLSTTDASLGTHVPDHTPGTRLNGNNGSSWMYVRASLSIAQYDAVALVYKTTGAAGASTSTVPVAVPLTITTGQVASGIGFAQIAFPDKGSYGWVNVGGTPIVKLAIDCEPYVPLYATATAGVLDDATVSVAITGLYATTSATAAGNYQLTAQHPQLKTKQVT